MVPFHYNSPWSVLTILDTGMVSFYTHRAQIWSDFTMTLQSDFTILTGRRYRLISLCTPPQHLIRPIISWLLLHTAIHMFRHNHSRNPRICRIVVNHSLCPRWYLLPEPSMTSGKTQNVNLDLYCKIFDNAKNSSYFQEISRNFKKSEVIF
jgi:hypothetical protein